jgi:hypothetical protein
MKLKIHKTLPLSKIIVTQSIIYSKAEVHMR